MGLGTRETRYAKAHQVAQRPPARLGIEGDGVAAKLRPGAGIAGDGCFPSTGRLGVVHTTGCADHSYGCGLLGGRGHGHCGGPRASGRIGLGTDSCEDAGSRGAKLGIQS